MKLSAILIAFSVLTASQARNIKILGEDTPPASSAPLPSPPTVIPPPPQDDLDQLRRYFSSELDSLNKIVAKLSDDVRTVSDKVDALRAIPPSPPVQTTANRPEKCDKDCDPDTCDCAHAAELRKVQGSRKTSSSNSNVSLYRFAGRSRDGTWYYDNNPYVIISAVNRSDGVLAADRPQPVVYQQPPVQYAVPPVQYAVPRVMTPVYTYSDPAYYGGMGVSSCGPMGCGSSSMRTGLFGGRFR